MPVAVAAALAWLATRFGIVVPEGSPARQRVDRRRAGGDLLRLARGLGRWMLGGVMRQPVYDQIQ